MAVEGKKFAMKNPAKYGSGTQEPTKGSIIALLPFDPSVSTFIITGLVHAVSSLVSPARFPVD
jgi:hypothetical protein